MPDESRFSHRMLSDLRRMLRKVDGRLAALDDADLPEVRVRLEDLRRGIGKIITQMEHDWPKR